MLEAQGKSDLLNQLRSVLPSYASCIYIRQPAPLGLGHAVLCAQPAVGAEPFFVHLADDLIRSEVACLQQMAEVYEAKRASVLGVQVVPHQDTEKYGIVAVEARQVADEPRAQHRREAEAGRGAVQPRGRRPLRADACDLRAPGEDRQGAGGEIQLTDGIAALMREEAVYAHRFTGKRYDCGSKLGYLQATVEYALGHPAARQGIPQVPAAVSSQPRGQGSAQSCQGSGSSARRRSDRAAYQRPCRRSNGASLRRRAVSHTGHAAPRPRLIARLRRPPCASTISRHSVSPRPVPVALVE